MRPERILYMEDNEFFADLLSKSLRDTGYTVEIAKDGVEGLALLAKESIDLVLLDLLMPKMDGFQVLQEMRKDEKLNKIPVIVLSNLGGEEDLNRAKELGAEIFLVKALTTPKEVTASVEQLLAQ